MHRVPLDFAVGTIYLVKPAETTMRIKCPKCRSTFLYRVFSVVGTGGQCTCQNINIKTVAAPESKHKFWVVVEYKTEKPLIYERKSLTKEE